MAEKDITAGEKWDDRIRHAIKQSLRLIFLITPHSKASPWVAAEAGAAWILDKQLIAAVMFVDVTELIDPLKRHQARRIETPEQLDGLVSELCPVTDHSLCSISGQWTEPHKGTVAFFRQLGDRAVGFYDYGSGKQKAGVFIGTLRGRVFEYKWNWLNGQFQGHGRMTLSDDDNTLAGQWWYDNLLREPEETTYRRASDQMPAWLKPADFRKYSNFLSGDDDS
jgi:hypothetical protein